MKFFQNSFANGDLVDELNEGREKVEIASKKFIRIRENSVVDLFFRQFW